ncbi:SAV_915 family protein [Kitasatospora cineracea]|uniref:SAV_915 family protein n=1 Tax=Kitasatospora cineracea TaxID=88074 RepID=UPI00343CADE6
MQQRHDTADPEPAQRVPSGFLLVPVRPNPLGCIAQLFRTALGDRTAVAFTSETLLTRVLGPDQSWAELSEAALRTLVAPLGVTVLTIDPQLVAAAPRSRPHHETAHAARALDPSTVTQPLLGPPPPTIAFPTG